MHELKQGLWVQSEPPLTMVSQIYKCSRWQNSLWLLTSAPVGKCVPALRAGPFQPLCLFSCNKPSQTPKTEQETAQMFTKLYSAEWLIYHYIMFCQMLANNDFCAGFFQVMKRISAACYSQIWRSGTGMSALMLLVGAAAQRGLGVQSSLQPSQHRLVRLGELSELRQAGWVQPRVGKSKVPALRGYVQLLFQSSQLLGAVLRGVLPQQEPQPLLQPLGFALQTRLPVQPGPQSLRQPDPGLVRGQSVSERLWRRRREAAHWSCVLPYARRPWDGSRGATRTLCLCLGVYRWSTVEERHARHITTTWPVCERGAASIQQASLLAVVLKHVRSTWEDRGVLLRAHCVFTDGEKAQGGRGAREEHHLILAQGEHRAGENTHGEKGRLRRERGKERQQRLEVAIVHGIQRSLPFWVHSDRGRTGMDPTAIFEDFCQGWCHDTSWIRCSGSEEKHHSVKIILGFSKISQKISQLLNSARENKPINR